LAGTSLDSEIDSLIWTTILVVEQKYQCILKQSTKSVKKKEKKKVNEPSKGL
jgi:hypothetical protein